MYVDENTPIKAKVGTREFDLTIIQEAVTQAFRMMTSIDVGNAAKNCAETVRASALTSALEQADALLAEMRGSMVVLASSNDLSQ